MKAHIERLGKLHKECMVCSEGHLYLQKGSNIVEGKKIDLYYYRCDECKSEIVDSELRSINRKIRIDRCG